MHNHEANAPHAAYSDHLNEASVACSLPLTPPPESTGNRQFRDETTRQSISDDERTAIYPVDDNTAIGMSLMQEASLYSVSENMPEKMETNFFDRRSEIRLSADACENEENVIRETTVGLRSTSSTSHDSPNTPTSMEDLDRRVSETKGRDVVESSKVVATIDGRIASTRTDAQNITTADDQNTAKGGSPTIDEEFDLVSSTTPWEFSLKRLSTEYPSSLFNANSKFKGTQQSDKQIYNVEVTFLTVNIEQATLSGYLQICGLTPDHPRLTTFFTGEIIGGPNQKFSFRTRDPSWGANDKTDITHWARFPAWRSLSSHAKKDINFTYPLDQGKWWQQEHIFMRWKEHFLVPDYKLKSIQGASFEGFYYICLNQIEGRVSGIYFHSRSEKYQQLELKHEGKQGVWNRGVCPSIEFR